DGPLALLDGVANDADIELAARLVCRFGKGRDAEEVEVVVTDKQGATRVLNVAPLTADAIPQEWYV
ncbi:MAG: tRNA (5-methylaminomethyl-2-thiouridylate)-methyltransferase, partial [Gammaproteobacteria bacterium]|nr:tRNA (5-methylaminomethyl-2-thiouridylate)-methyltransferase [Gammaproteobacteria bacterium]